MTDDAGRGGPPPFDRPFEGEDTKQRVYGAVLHAGSRRPPGSPSGRTARSRGRPEASRCAECVPRRGTLECLGRDRRGGADGDGPGFGVVGTLAGIGGAGCLL